MTGRTQFFTGRGEERPKHDICDLAASSSEIENESSFTLTWDKLTVKCRKWYQEELRVYFSRSMITNVENIVVNHV
jgi:hypothetical protein